MGIFDKLDRRASVMGQMADTLGVDFPAEITRSPDVAAKYREAVMRCAHCSHDGECKGWMAEHPNATETPDYCRNKDLLEGMAKA